MCTWPLFPQLGDKLRAPGFQGCCPNESEGILEPPSEQHFLSLCLSRVPAVLSHVEPTPSTSPLPQACPDATVLGQPWVKDPHFSKKKKQRRDLVRQAEVDLGSEGLLVHFCQQDPCVYRVRTVLLACPGTWAGLRAGPAGDAISSYGQPHH